MSWEHSDGDIFRQPANREAVSVKSSNISTLYSSKPSFFLHGKKSPSNPKNGPISNITFFPFLKKKNQMMSSPTSKNLSSVIRARTWAKSIHRVLSRSEVDALFRWLTILCVSLRKTVTTHILKNEWFLWDFNIVHFILLVRFLINLRVLGYAVERKTKIVGQILLPLPLFLLLAQIL